MLPFGNEMLVQVERREGPLWLTSKHGLGIGAASSFDEIANILPLFDASELER